MMPITPSELLVFFVGVAIGLGWGSILWLRWMMKNNSSAKHFLRNFFIDIQQWKNKDTGLIMFDVDDLDRIMRKHLK